MRPPAIRRGFSLIAVVLVLLAVLAAILLGQGVFGTGVGEQVRRSLRAGEALALGDSLIEAYVAQVTLDANGGPDGTAVSTPLCRAFRDPPAATGELELPAVASPAFEVLTRSQERAGLPPPKVAGRLLFQRYYDSSDLAAHDDRYGTLEVVADVPYASARASEIRRVTRCYEVRVQHLGLPAPFDSLPLCFQAADAFVNDGADYAAAGTNDVNETMRQAALTVAGAGDGLRELVARLKDLEKKLKGPAGKLKGQAEAVAAALTAAAGACDALKGELDNAGQIGAILSGAISPAEPRLFPSPCVMFFNDGAKNLPPPAPCELKRFNLPARNRERVQRMLEARRALEAAQSAWAAALTRVEGGDVGADVEAPGLALARAARDKAQADAELLRGVAEFQRATVMVAGTAFPRYADWFELAAPGQWETGPVPAAAGEVAALHAGKAQFLLEGKDSAELAVRLGELADRYGPVFQGIVSVQNESGPPLVLDSTHPGAERWGKYAGRFLLVVRGDCTLKEVKRADPARDTLTVVCAGKLTLAGRVEASLLARGALATADSGTSIAGNLVVTEQAFNVPKSSPAAVLEHVTLEYDPRLAAWNAQGNKPGHTTVFVNPVPIYVGSPRTVKR